MKCVNCGNDLPENAKFCPACGRKAEAESVGGQTVEPTGDSAAEPVGGQTVEPAGDSAAESVNSQATGSATVDSALLVKIGTAVLAVFYAIRGIKTVFGGFKTLFSMFYWGFSFWPFMGIPLTWIQGILYIGMAGILVLVGFAKVRNRVKELFTSFAALGVGVIAVSLLSMLISIPIYVRYIGYGTSVFSLFGAPFKTLFWTMLVVGIVYGLLYLSKEAPVLAFYKNIGSVGDFAKGCMEAVKSAVQDVTASAKTGAKDTQDKAEAKRAAQAQAAQATAQTQTAQQTTAPVPPVQPTPKAPNGTPLKTNRGLLGYILLTLITCGIYGYYFIYSIAKDVNTACEGDGQSTGGLLKFILLSIITCGIYSWIWQYSLGNRLAANAPRYGMSFQENGTTILLWDLFGMLLCGIGPFIAMNIIIKNTNSICMAYNRNNGLI